RSTPERKPRLSVPMSPLPASRPSARTAVMPSGSASPATPATPATPAPASIGATRAAPSTGPTQSAAAPVATSPKRNRAILWIVAAVVLLAAGGYFGVTKMRPKGTSAAQNAALQRGVLLWQQGKAANAVS